MDIPAKAATPFIALQPVKMILDSEVYVCGYCEVLTAKYKRWLEVSQ